MNQVEAQLSTRWESNMHKSLVFLGMVILLTLSATASGQLEENFRTLVVNDQSGKVAVLQVEGRTYVDLKRMAQIAHGSISSEGNRIVLDVPCMSAYAPAKTAEPEHSTSVGLSREFAKAGIEEISLMREWASTLANAVQNGYPITDSWVAGYRAQAQSGLASASAAVSTDADRNAFQLLGTEFENVQAWSNKVLDARKSMGAANYALSPDALKNEPLSQKIISCGRFLGQMFASGSFQDEASCH